VGKPLSEEGGENSIVVTESIVKCVMVVGTAEGAVGGMDGEGSCVGGWEEGGGAERKEVVKVWR